MAYGHAANASQSCEAMNTSHPNGKLCPTLTNGASHYDTLRQRTLVGTSTLDINCRKFCQAIFRKRSASRFNYGESHTARLIIQQNSRVFVRLTPHLPRVDESNERFKHKQKNLFDKKFLMQKLLLENLFIELC